MTLDEDSLLLGCNCGISAQILHSSFGAFTVQVATTTPQTSRGLLVVGPDMAKFLAVVALSKASLSFV
jgi:hypothetical protein